MIDRVRLGHDDDDDTVMEVISSVTVYLTELLTTVRPARRSSTLAVLRKKTLTGVDCRSCRHRPDHRVAGAVRTTRKSCVPRPPLSPPSKNKALLSQAKPEKTKMLVSCVRVARTIKGDGGRPLDK